MSDQEPPKTYRMLIAEVLTISSILIGSFYFLHADIQSMKASMLAHQESTANQMLSHQQRTDRLYEMFVDLLKERK